jgi:hypothetical protein
MGWPRYGIVFIVTLALSLYISTTELAKVGGSFSKNSSYIMM